MGSLTGTSSLGLRRYLGSRYCTKTRFPASSADSIHPSHYCPVEPAQLARKHGTKSMGWWLWHRLWPCRGWRLWGGQARARTSACSSLHGQGVPRSHSWRHVSPTAPCSLLKTKDKPVVGIRARRPRRCISQVHLGSKLGIAASVALVCVPRLDCLRLLASADWDASCPVRRTRGKGTQAPWATAQ